MKKTVLAFGILSGVVSAAMMASTVPFIDTIGVDNGVFVGCTAIVISFLLVYFGTRCYRDNVHRGQVTFAKGASQAEVDDMIQQDEQAEQMLANPLINAAATSSPNHSRSAWS